MCLYFQEDAGFKEPHESVREDEDGNYLCYKVLREISGRYVSPYQRHIYQTGTVKSDRSTTDLTYWEEKTSSIIYGIHLFTSLEMAIQERDQWVDPVLFCVKVPKKDVVAFGGFYRENDCVVVIKMDIDLEKDRLTEEDIKKLLEEEKTQCA